MKTPGSIVLILTALSGAVPVHAQMKGPHLHPWWSPDGAAVVFERTTDGDSEIVVMDLATRRTRQLTNNRAYDGTPVWIGDVIYFQTDRDGERRWYAMDAGGGGQRVVPGGRPRESRSADGRICVTDGKWEGGQAVFRCDAGVPPRRLTAEHYAEQPAVSADGRYVIYENRDTQPAGIYMMNADGSQRHRLSDGTAPMWSADGLVALFKSLNARGVWEVTVYDLRQPAKRQLSEGVHPSFSPDGRQILFMSDRSGGNEIWLMSAAGDEVTCLTCSTP